MPEPRPAKMDSQTRTPSENELVKYAKSLEALLSEALERERMLRESIEEHQRKCGGNVWGDEARACWGKATIRLWDSLSTPAGPEESDE